MHYATEHAAFPHESTADQFFSESQFESYRRLGHFLAGEILEREPRDHAERRRRGPALPRAFRALVPAEHAPSPRISAGWPSEVDELFERLRTSKELAFLSRQFYPEWRNLFGDERQSTPAAQTEDLVFVPRDERSCGKGSTSAIR